MKQYIVDAFSDKVFKGNQAAVCIMDEWIPEELMMNITLENNFSETAFAVREGDRYRLRWFTPGGEIDLCGHATLGTAYVIFRFYDTEASVISFRTMSGELVVRKEQDLLVMDFPSYELKQVTVTDEMEQALGIRPLEAYMGRDLLCVLPDEEDVVNLMPDLNKIKNLEGLLVHVTAKGSDFDCVSRSFAPKLNVDEDPVCGSGHCHIAPYWSKKLGNDELAAYQASKRSGVLYCQVSGNRTQLAGKVALYSSGEIYV